MESNYKKLNTQWQEKFLSLDHEALMKKIPSLKREGEFITIQHFGKKYGVHSTEGFITAFDDNQAINETVKLNIYTFFWYCSEEANFQNKWVPFRDLKGAGAFGPAFQNGINEVIAKTFSGHVDKLRNAIIQLGGESVATGDASGQLNAFPEIPMRIMFWDGDDEFSAQANILFDVSAADFIHVESVVTIAMEGVDRLVHLSGLPYKGSHFCVG